jgi:hypothetical protein
MDKAYVLRASVPVTWPLPHIEVQKIGWACLSLGGPEV